ncbi:Zinc finger protein 1 [Fasciola gigantica]|uniref:Zinc finger protein 1 n=1 Tax=Fasciola gigantica TaxID=46835 RepID=A0A504Z8V9_FASGI|nr:Zinc finger protein 1 [Fasciola gigantica]
MGLCKCEKKKVTTLFCFEHRVNVCDFCMVASHPRCVVKPYLGWLTDSGFDPSCAICNERFDADESKECVRLVCLDVFHWDCLDRLISAAPPTTAPSGFLCPSCEHPIIPQRNQGGPVAEALRSFLNRTQWATNNLTQFQEFPEAHAAHIQPFNSLARHLQNSSGSKYVLSVSSSRYSSIINTFMHRYSVFVSARIYSFSKPSHLRRPRTILSLLALFIFLVVFVQHLHSSSPSDIRGDPLFDPHMNPNIHLDEHAAAAIHGGVRFNPEVHDKSHQ